MFSPSPGRLSQAYSEDTSSIERVQAAVEHWTDGRVPVNRELWHERRPDSRPRLRAGAGHTAGNIHALIEAAKRYKPAPSRLAG